MNFFLEIGRNSIMKAYVTKRVRPILYGAPCIAKISQENSVFALHTSSIYQDFMKSDNLLHKWGFVDSQSVSTIKHPTKKVLNTI